MVYTRTNTAAEWAEENPTLRAGELGIEKDTKKHKLGDGVTPWVNLSYQFSKVMADALYAPITNMDSVQRLTDTGRGVVVISMDDAFAAMRTVAGMMESRNQRGTFCITPGLMNDPTGVAKILSSDIINLHTAGHEIAAHSQTHANFTTLTGAQAITELNQPKTMLEALIGEKVTTFCYPYGTASGGRTANTDQWVYPLYDRVLDTAQYSFAAFHPRYSEPPALIPRTSWVESNQAQVLAMVRKAAESPVIASIFFHNLNTAVNPTTAQVLELLDLCVTLGVPVVPAKEVFGSFHNVVNASFETGSLAPWWPFTSSGGTAIIENVTPDIGISGSKALRLTVPVDPGSAYVRQMYSCQPGQTYTLSFRAKVVSGTIAQANDAFGRIQAFGGGMGTALGTISTAAPTLSTWAKFSIDYTAPQDAALLAIELVVAGVATGAAVDFDHVWFGPKNQGNLG